MSGEEQTGTLLDGNHVLNVFFNGAFWSQLLTALDAANLFAHLHGEDRRSAPAARRPGDAGRNPGVWRIAHTDIFLGEDFDAPAVGCGERPRPGSRRPSRGSSTCCTRATRPALPHTPPASRARGGRSAASALVLAAFFFLGPTATRAARLPLAAPVRIISGLLQGAIVQSFGTAAANPAVLALQVLVCPRALRYPSSFSPRPQTRTQGSWTSRTCSACSPAVRRRRGASRRERRIRLATSLGALYQLVIQPSSSAQSANALVSRLADKILTLRPSSSSCSRTT